MNKHIKTVLMIGILCLFSPETYAVRFHEVEVKVHGAVYETYDDNITYVKDNKIGDFYTKPSVGASLIYEGKTSTASVSGNYYHEFYADNSGFDNNSGDVTAAFASELSKYDRITLSDTWTRTYEPRSFEDQFGFVGGRYSSDRNRVNFGYARDVSQHFGLSTRYSNEYNAYSRNDIAKSFLNTAGIEGAYILSSDFTIFTAYDFSRRDFDNGPHATTNTWTGGFRKFLTKQVYVDASTGVDFIRAYSGNEFAKPFGTIALTDDINDRTNASLMFSKRYNTISYQEDIFDQLQVSGQINHEITRKLTGTVSAFYGRGEYVNTGQIDDLVGASAGLAYEINDKWKARALYSFSNQDSTSYFSEYRKNTVTFGLATEF
ncbi:MAG: outer membrane beta-barrel protein [Candidatus Omnitrophica bacterium]|nr:outer membrane beta-barrel protein [Candidatus Omnitrophota bacterium]MDD5311204.1 outer membrane beta-barrel protein [Candidatus Omnitrophota bacterium]MDD5546129.1 outer membrane beta-barrel protein [Candidatus Omnitrophota bacterium]